ncbi:MAG TPA: hypothetical protein VHY56_06860 [Candidatus Binataceae bacterium]|nr:hypothetical protein [Candidatus Binataceae bacterium]
MLLKPQADFIIVKKLAPVGLCNTFPDGGAGAGILFDQAQSGAPHQMLGIRTGVRGDLRKLVESEIPTPAFAALLISSIWRDYRDTASPCS